MIFYQNWEAYPQNNPTDRFPAVVPGNVQSDYAKAHNYGDIHYGLNFQKYRWMEDVTFVYESHLEAEYDQGEKVFFVTHGIDYKYDVFINDIKIVSHEGMFSKIEVDLTDYLTGDDILRVKIYPIPKYEKAKGDDRTQAVDSVKPAVGYGWDWHPRLLCSGLWDETYIETRDEAYIGYAEAFYTLSDDFKSAEVEIKTDSQDVYLEICSPDGETIYKGNNQKVVIENPKLWWCNGKGEPNLYSYTVRRGNFSLNSRFGIRKIELEMNEGTWNEVGATVNSRYGAPMTICLNGEKIFAKGSNWVNPEIMNGEITKERYYELVMLAKDAHMNILRSWGGAIVNKESFFDVCDELGIMVWQEFPLACNNYVSTPHYLEILEQEATAIVKKGRKHPCHVLWCGGNELFNDWSGMTDQSLALRLLNKVCYENDMEKPFIMTAPFVGMAHGPYYFYNKYTGKDVYQQIQETSYAAYSEFGSPSMADAEYIKSFIPEEEVGNIKESESIRCHHGTKAHSEHAWICMDTLEKYFGEITTLEEAAEKSSWLGCEGYKAIFEEARRQKPHCSMALNWCFNEPWKTVANNSIVSYPSIPKRTYYAVKSSLRDVILSAKFEKFAWEEGEIFKAEIWLLNDSDEAVSDDAYLYIEMGAVYTEVMHWSTGNVQKNSNLRGNVLQFVLPKSESDFFVLKLVSKNGYDNEYILKYNKKECDK